MHFTQTSSTANLELPIFFYTFLHFIYLFLLLVTPGGSRTRAAGMEKIRRVTNLTTLTLPIEIPTNLLNFWNRLCELYSSFRQIFFHLVRI